MAIDITVPVGTVLEAVVRCDSADQQAGENVLHYVVSETSGGDPTLSSLAAAIAAFFAADYAALIANSAQFTGVYLTSIGPGPRSITVAGLASGMNGTAGVNLLPEQCSGLITKLTQKGGRGGRGRLYVPFPSSSDLTPGGLPTNGYLARLSGLAVDIKNQINFAGGGLTWTLTPCLVTRVRPVQLVGTTPIGDTLIRKGFATQRRRSYYGRKNPLAT